MDKKNSNIDMGAALNKLNTPEPEAIYWVKRTTFTDTLCLTKHGKPILVIPDELEEDFIYILSRVSTFDKLHPHDADDLKDVL